MIFSLVGTIFHWTFKYASTVNNYLNNFAYKRRVNSTTCICKFAKVQIIIFTQL